MRRWKSSRNEKEINAAAVIILGGADQGKPPGCWSLKMDARKRITPMGTVLGDIHEMTGTGIDLPE